MGKASRKKAPPPVGTTAAPAAAASSGVAKPLPGQMAEDVASLRLVDRPCGATEWVFASRAHSSPPLASMSEACRKKVLEAQIGGADPEKYWWWITDEALEDMAEQLQRQHYCLVDNMLGEKHINALHAEVRAARGQLSSSRLAGGRTGALLSYSHAAVRGDLVGWFDDPVAWPQLGRYLTKVDTLVDQLRAHQPEVDGVANRSKAMVTCYPGGGARYVRHCSVVKVTPSQRPSSASVPPLGAPGGSGQLGTPSERSAH